MVSRKVKVKKVPKKKFPPSYNQLPSEYRLWMIQASDWDWDDYLGYMHNSPYSWNCTEWVTSEASLKRIKTEFRAGDIVVCYQAAPIKAVVGFTTLHADSFLGAANQKLYLFFLLDQNQYKLERPLPYETMKNDPILKNSEKVLVRQSVVFRLSKEDFERIIELCDLDDGELQELDEVIGYGL